MPAVGKRRYAPCRDIDAQPVTITGAVLGSCRAADRIFDDSNVARMLRGEQFIDTIPTRFRHAMLDKHITRLVKSDNGGPTFETIARRRGCDQARGPRRRFRSGEGVRRSADRVAALDR